MHAIDAHLEHLRLLGHSAATIYGRATFLNRLARALPVALLSATGAHLGAWRAGLAVPGGQPGCRAARPAFPAPPAETRFRG